MGIEGLPLRPGDTGEAIRDLQRRLVAAGQVVEAEPGRFDDATEVAVREFQVRRGLLPDGVCGRDTWSALVEAGYQIGDRLLYLRRPMLRGDDVDFLQRCLSTLGFHVGRIDGIFGPDTERALKDFQRNAGLTTDGVCGPDVVAALGRLGQRVDGPTAVAALRERERLELASRELVGRRVSVGEAGGLDVLAGAVMSEIHEQGAITTFLSSPDASDRAAGANDFGAEVHLDLAVSSDGHGRAAYFAVPAFESPGGRRLAELVARELEAFGPVEAVGLRVPILRETKMTAVLCQLPTATTAVVSGVEVAAGLATAIGDWSREPVSNA